jgi:peptidyl-prolyl cis-trans isomerase-like 4
LDEQHTVFGRVSEGFDVVQKISDVYTSEEGKPLQVVMIKHTIILDDPFEDPKGLENLIPDKSPLPPRNLWNELGILDEDEANDILTGKANDKPIEQLEEEQNEKEAKSRGQVLEIVNSSLN